MRLFATHTPSSVKHLFGYFAYFRFFFLTVVFRDASVRKSCQEVRGGLDHVGSCGSLKGFLL